MAVFLDDVVPLIEQMTTSNRIGRCASPLGDPYRRRLKRRWEADGVWYRLIDPSRGGWAALCEAAGGARWQEAVPVGVRRPAGRAVGRLAKWALRGGRLADRLASLRAIGSAPGAESLVKGLVALGRRLRSDPRVRAFLSVIGQIAAAAMVTVAGVAPFRVEICRQGFRLEFAAGSPGWRVDLVGPRGLLRGFDAAADHLEITIDDLPDWSDVRGLSVRRAA